MRKNRIPSTGISSSDASEGESFIIPLWLIAIVVISWSIWTWHLIGGLERAQFQLRTLVSLPGFISAGNPMVNLLEWAGGLLSLMGLVLSALLIGTRILLCVKPAEVNQLEEAVLAIGLGLGAISLFGLVMGLCGLFSPLALGAGLLVLSVPGALMIYRRISSAGLSTPRLPGLAWIEVGGCILAACFILVNLLGALGPQIGYDTLTYHFALPKLYLLKARIVATPHTLYAGLPFNTEILFGLGMALKGEILAKLIPWVISMGLLACIAMWMRRFGSLRAGIIAGILLLSSVAVSFQVWDSYVELMWAFFGFLSIFSVCMFIERNDSHWLTLAGVFAGLTLGVKYNAYSIIAPLVGMLVVYARNGRERILNPLIASGLALLVLAPWLIKNIAHYHNPIFPFFHDFFTGSDSPDWRALLADSKSRSLRHVLASANGVLETLSSYWSRKSSPSDDIGIALFGLTPFLFLARRRSHSQKLFWGFVFSWLAWALTSSMPRFLISGIPLLAILLATAASDERLPSRFRDFLLSIVLLLGTGAFAEVSAYWMERGSWPVLTGRRSASDYLSHVQPAYPGPYYPAAEFINSQLPPSAKVLLLFEQRGYFLERDFVATSILVRNPIVDLARQASSGRDLAASLKRLGFTHLLINHSELARLQAIPSVAEIREAPFMGSLGTISRKVFEYRRADGDDRAWVSVYELP